jgi:hypothetical protein
MKGLKISFAAIVALVAMSFIIASHSKVFEKRANIKNCYKVKTTLNYLSTCASTPIWTAVDCTNTGIGQVLKNDLSLGTFSSSTVICSGGSTFCCINLKSTSTDPCPPANLWEQKGNGSLKDFNGVIIPTTDFVLVNAVECKL